MASVGAWSQEAVVLQVEWRSRRTRAAYGALVALSLVAALSSTACAGPAPAKRPGFVPPATVSAAVTLAPPAMDPEQEIELLARVRTTPALLRRAWLELQVRRPQLAIDAAAQVLYGAVKPSANEESFARWFRAEAYAQQGQADRGAFDRERARALAIDPDLRRRVGGSASRTGADEPITTADDSVVIQPRNAWNARGLDRDNVEAMGAIRRLTIHHSAMYFRDTRPATCAAQIQLIQREHMQQRGYGDIGYHYLIDPSGRIWQGRDLRWQGAHASGSNNVGNVGICLLGNFMRGRNGQGPTPAQVLAMRQLTALVMRRFGLDADDIYCHSDLKPTDCPGALMVPVVAQMVRDLRSRGRTDAAGQ
jgi:hypothetical protein